MATFPKPTDAYDISTPIPITPYRWRPIFRTVRGGPYAGGKAKARVTRPFPIFGVTLRYALKDRHLLMPIIEFHEEMLGGATRFTFVDFHGWNVPDPNGVQWDRLFCCVATPGQTVVELPIITGATGPTLQMHVNGVDADATFSLGAGDAGRDRATMDTPLADGDVVTVSGIGRRTHYMRFLADELEISTNANGLISIGDIAMIEDRDEEG